MSQMTVHPALILIRNGDTVTSYPAVWDGSRLLYPLQDYDTTAAHDTAVALKMETDTKLQDSSIGYIGERLHDPIMGASTYLSQFCGESDAYKDAQSFGFHDQQQYENWKNNSFSYDAIASNVDQGWGRHGSNDWQSQLASQSSNVPLTAPSYNYDVNLPNRFLHKRSRRTATGDTTYTETAPDGEIPPGYEEEEDQEWTAGKVVDGSVTGPAPNYQG
ncbi:hypothetical protein TREMEDRAFT_66073 [Tremella mesenterica DSM 1558]|uniref:uncharacterized protein n=1 Tax=Tremella mesenterica (strain ATCC 24925 / CBS 8224 / DSM 1558 / NBRC 9311 / NRRL Y-6157 / RJB 2259-6 / UBC 559-6) TaxID=578456 RepID=UPI00032BC0E8|nr:uncharacterized protein TREMEDRAFT_66073 [Tremella mesenterica DSM 1558]EIW65983.1 hypothetical protein TREMEDRAFT_66073 [Tremella mesenterica DSM 1558]